MPICESTPLDQMLSHSDHQVLKIVSKLQGQTDDRLPLNVSMNFSRVDPNILHSWPNELGRVPYLTAGFTIEVKDVNNCKS